jgi:serine/threonine-protein kinase
LAAARLQHPNIVQVFDSGEDTDSHRHFIVMEYVNGPSCADLLREEKQLDLDQAVGILRDACHGLDYAHRAGVVHRDVKPGNLLMVEETGATKLADFGIAKAAEQTRLTQVGAVLGTAAYLSPEQAQGHEAGPPSDIYSLGVCAYQFLTGKLPHEYASLTELALKQLEQPVEPVSYHRTDVPPELDRAIGVCLARDPENRFPSTIELAEALDAGLQGRATEVTRRLDSAMQTDSTEATQALADVTAATQALRTRRETAPPRPAPPRGPARVDRHEPERSPRKRGMGKFLAVLAVIMAAVAITLALLAASDDGGGGGIDPVNGNDVQEQIDGLKQFLREHQG